MTRTMLILVGLLFMSATAFAGDFQDGVAAYDRGDYATAVAKYTKAAEKGDVYAQYNLGLMYAIGEGVPRDYEQAVYWHTKAAEQWDADAQYSLGLAYANGQGVPKDFVTTYMWWNLAAAQGIEEARTNLDALEEWWMTPEKIAQAQCLAREWRPVTQLGSLPQRDLEKCGQARQEPVAVDRTTEQSELGDYKARISAKVRSRVVMPPNISGNPEAIYEVLLWPGGDVAEAKLIQSSGVPAYDKAVSRAIMAAQPFPVPHERELFQDFRRIVLSFRPKE